jgi:Ca2+-binding EF-hand superfamily protein
VSVIEKLILEAIQRTSGYVRENEAEFVKRVRDEAALQQETAVKENRKKLTKSKRRREEINTLIKKLYESYAAEKIPEKHFSELLKGYDTEQAGLDTEIEKLQAEIDRYNTDSVRADRFIELVKRHTEFTELSTSLLNEFIEKVIVHEADKSSGKRTMKVDIYLNFIGKFELPEWEEEEPEKLTGTRGRKLRRDMTEEELKHEREIDHRYYARKVAAKKAAEAAERAAILQGTVYEIQPDQSEESEVKKSA